MKNLKLWLIIAAGVIAVILLCVFGVQSSQNKAISMKERIETAYSDIKVQEMARVSKVYNLADCVKEYDKHESETLENLAKSMGNGKGVENAQILVEAATYAYPELKSSENYQKLMNELAIIENTLAQYRENYNKCVERYNTYVEGFPARIFLDWTGYEKTHYERLNYETTADAPQNLFGE